MIFLREKNFDSILESTSAMYAVQTGMLKAICAVESGFDPNYTEDSSVGKKIGLAALRSDAGRMAGTNYNDTDLKDPKVNLEVAARLLRQFIRGWAENENPDMYEAVNEFRKLNRSADPDYMRNYIKYYWHYSQQPGEPHSYTPLEALQEWRE